MSKWFHHLHNTSRHQCLIGQLVLAVVALVVVVAVAAQHPIDPWF
jgi:hypothetical protein